VRPDGNYTQESFVGIAEFAPDFALVGGINAPKKIKCLGTDGRWRAQLVKGQQPLRVDGEKMIK